MNKWLIIILTVLTLVHIVYAEGEEDGFSMTIGTNIVKIAPSRLQGQIQSEAWVANTAYPQGELVIYGPDYADDGLGNPTDGQVYMAVAAGTSSTNAPVHMNGDVSDGGVTWRHINTTVKLRPSPRAGIDITLQTTNDVYGSTSSNLVFGKGVLLSGKGASWSPATQRPVYLIGNVTNNVVTGQEYVQ